MNLEQGLLFLRYIPFFFLHSSFYILSGKWDTLTLLYSTENSSKYRKNSLTAEF